MTRPVFTAGDFQGQSKDGDVLFSDYDAFIIAGVANARLAPLMAALEALFDELSEGPKTRIVSPELLDVLAEYRKLVGDT